MASWSLSFSISLLPVELDGLDVRPLADEEAEDDAASLAGHVDLDVVEEARVPEGADVAREVLGLEGVAGLLAEVGEDVFLRDAAVAADVDARDGLIACELARWPGSSAGA